MDDKTALLAQLRIERPTPPASTGRRRGVRSVFLIGIAIAVVAAAGSVAYWNVSQAKAVPVQTAVARSLPSGATGVPTGGSMLDASGYVVALRDTTVSAKAIYKVRQMLVQQGERVKAGQMIAELDDSNVRAALEEAVVQVKQARAALAQAKLARHDARPTFLRQQKELAEGLISQDAFDATKGSYDAARAQVAVAAENLAVDQSAVAGNRRLEDDTVIRAPFDGVVTATNAQPGQIVSPQFSGGGGLAEIVDMSSLEVDVDVSENFISRVHPDQPATVTLDAYPDWHIPAAVIAIIPTADKAKATVQVRVGFKQKDPRILPQMGARVSFLAAALSRDASPAASQTPGSRLDSNTAVLVPSAAVETGGNTRTGTVFVIDGSTVAGRTVRLGGRSGDNQWILSGLDAGVSVAIGDFSKLRDGVRVHITQ
jgi:RND family efflux transporter MFP subunit